MAEGFDRVNVAAESDDPSSLLSLYRRLIRLRRSSPALRTGRYGLVAATRNFLIYRRQAEEEAFVVAVGFGFAETEVPVPRGRIEIGTSVDREGERVAGWTRLGKNEALVIRVDRPADT